MSPKKKPPGHTVAAFRINLRVVTSPRQKLARWGRAAVSWTQRRSPTILVVIALGLGEAIVYWDSRRSHYGEDPLQHAADLAQVLQLVIALFAVVPIANAAMKYGVAVSERQRQGELQAWQVLALASGKAGNLGRVKAMQHLNGLRISLIGLDLTGGAVVDGVQLKNARLDNLIAGGASMRGAGLEGANLSYGDLRNADLSGGTKLRSAWLIETQFCDADLSSADLSDAKGHRADFSGATKLVHAKLERAELQGASFEGADLYGATLTGGVLAGTKFSGASLRNAILKSVDLSKAAGLTWPQLELARDLSDAIFPDYLGPRPALQPPHRS